MLGKLALTAALSLFVGVAGTYAAIHVTAVCSVSPVRDNGMKTLPSGPDLPLTGPRYK